MDKLLAELEEVERLAQELEDLKHDMVKCQTLREAAKQAEDAVRKLQQRTQTSTSTEKDRLWLLLPNRTFFELSHETAVNTLEEEIQALEEELKGIQSKQRKLLHDLHHKESTSEHVGSNLVNSMLEVQEPR
mmetsp:Transcript_790/g.4926  ORF Transcript_790/g.4926 Transcript_790/m.4926 type:complete len:132 (-) Transcript_790:667-1062(-)